jgi:glycosyltransferase involved in cell wall biosynthesis
MTAMPARVLHISADFPDPIVPAKTRAIRTFLELTGEGFDHQVISINRRSPGLAAVLASLLPGRGAQAVAGAMVPFEWGQSLTYAAPGRGLLHRTCLLQLADALVDQVLADQVLSASLPDLIVGHKLTVEGIVVQRMAERLGVPFAITVQGDTDTKIMAARPDLAAVFRQIFQQARSVTVFAPWTLEHLEARLGKREGPVAIIPCPTELDEALAPQTGGRGLISVFHLQSHKRKNLAGMADALRILDARGAAPELAICGGGSAADIAAARASAGAAPGLCFEGPLERGAVAARMNAACAFVLPSLRESFGLVFIEALFAGLPIIYPKGQAVSGHFDECPFAIGVSARDPQALAAAMAQVVSQEAALKTALARWQVSDEAQRFRRAVIGRNYGAALHAAIQTVAGRSPAVHKGAS